MSDWQIITDIPDWVLKQSNLIRNKYGGSSSWALNKVWYLKGRTFRYRLEFAGQGGNVLVVAKKLRKKIVWT